MVASARLAAGLSGLRNRNTRVTNKTQLRVVRGSVEADPIILDDEDDEKNRILASQGVDEEDANEHHLQAALFASSQRTLSNTHFKSSNSNHDSSAYIPTPDAAGLVTEYDALYPAGQYKDSATHLRFSDSIDESCLGGLSGAFTYFLDERDLEWLERNNGAARGEGTSACGGVNGVHGSNAVNGPSSVWSRGVPRAPHARSAKARGKEPEQRLPNSTQPTMVINEDHFELVMGLFEKWTDESVSPYLHLARDPEHFPDFTNYERLFSKPFVPAMFANFTIPSNVPSPEQMTQIAKAIYPWWKERRREREGHRIVPPLNVLILEAQEKEDKTSGSPYICFRKRDVKPIRKTRTNNVTHTEKLMRLRVELQSSLELAKLVMQREKLKSESVAASELVWRSRESLAESMKQLNNSAPGSVPPGDESLLFDKEHKARKKVETTASGRIILTNRRLSHARTGLSELLDPHSPLTLNGDTSHLFELRQRAPSDRVAALQREVDRELTKTRKDDVYWEDMVDIPHQLPSTSIVDKFFVPVLPTSSDNTNPASISSSSLDPQRSSRAWRTTRSTRLRVGRGGRLHFDRRLHTPQPHRLLQREWAGYPPRVDDPSAAQQDAERWASRSWRPRNEAGGEVRLTRKERQRGEEYWAHPSIYDSQGELGAIKQTFCQPHKEAQETVLGFEQSSLGWDGHGHRGPWARTRIGRDEEGWRPTPVLTVESDSLGAEITPRNETERDRLVEAWRSRAVEDVGGGGGALAFFMDGNAPGNEGGGEMPWEQNGEKDLDDINGQSLETVEHAWRVEERWRYDSEGDPPAQDGENRFLLDDFQRKFMRTTITLLDSQDHDAISMDTQLLVPPPLKQNRYLDHQLRLQHPGLPHSTSESTPTTTPKHPSRQMPIPSRPGTSPAPFQNGVGVHAPLSLSPAHNLAPTLNGSSSSARSLSSPKQPNGTSALGLMPSGARLPPDSSAATIRVSTPVRTKHSPVGVPVPQAGVTSALPPGSAHGNGDAAPHGAFQPHTAPSYPTLKTALGRVIVGQQDLQQGRIFPKPKSNNANGANGIDTAVINPPLGVNNIHLKFPAQRAAQLRALANGETHGAITSVETTGADRYSLAQQLALPRLPTTNGSRPG